MYWVTTVSKLLHILQIAGFTAWSSSREPEQVFVLLENLYRAFDKCVQCDVRLHHLDVEISPLR
jgi:hypothetical protein